MSKGIVFVSSDWICEMLASELDMLDCEVIRGPVVAGPELTTYDPVTAGRLLGRADVILASPSLRVDRATLLAAPRLRAVIAPAIGVENIDVDAATELGIIIGHGATPENFLGMAEATVLLIAALALQLPYKQRLLAENAPRPRELAAHSVRGRTVGLVGMGRIARGVVERLQGWETDILYFDPYVPQDQAPAGTRSVALDELLQRSDFVSLHVTVTRETQAMIGERELRLMKPTAYLVNTARGAVLDEAAVYRVLKEGVIAGAALDTFVQEPPAADSPLREFVGADNVILTPHIIGHTKDVMDSLRVAVVENISRVLGGTPPLYIKNPEVIERWTARFGPIG